MRDIRTAIERAAGEAGHRLTLWARIIGDLGSTTLAEVGVWRGQFAQHILQHCPTIQTYYMVDPWRHVCDWNKPLNVSNEQFDAVFKEAMSRTDFAAAQRHLLRGTTAEVADSLPAQGLDFAYIDGDHTLRGITIDLTRLYPKIRDGGLLAGDDFKPTPWQHGCEFEPTLVFPQAIYFAEATGSIIYGLPHDQFCMIVDRTHDQFDFVDLTGRYGDRSLLGAFRCERTDFVGRVERYLRSALRRTGRVSIER